MDCRQVIVIFLALTLSFGDTFLLHPKLKLKLKLLKSVTNGLSAVKPIPPSEHPDIVVSVPLSDLIREKVATKKALLSSLLSKLTGQDLSLETPVDVQGVSMVPTPPLIGKPGPVAQLPQLPSQYRVKRDTREKPSVYRELPQTPIYSSRKSPPLTSSRKTIQQLPPVATKSSQQQLTLPARYDWSQPLPGSRKTIAQAPIQSASRKTPPASRFFGQPQFVPSSYEQPWAEPINTLPALPFSRKTIAQPATKTVQQPIQPGTKTVQQPLPPATKTVQQPLPPATKTVQQPLPPATKTVQQPLPPATKTVQQPLPPATKTVQQPLPPTMTIEPVFTPIKTPPQLPPATKTVQQPLPPATKTVQQPLPPVTKTVQQPQQPATKTVVQPLPPATKTVQQPLPPATKTVQQPLPPATKTVQQPLPPATKTVQQPLPPATKTVQQPLPPATKTVVQPQSPPTMTIVPVFTPIKTPPQRFTQLRKLQPLPAYRKSVLPPSPGSRKFTVQPLSTFA